MSVLCTLSPPITNERIVMKAFPSVDEAILAAAVELSVKLRALTDMGLFTAPELSVTHVYDPLQYAWGPHEAYVRRFGNGRRRVVLLGMNPGPYGMMQIGVPFGEVAAVRDWMGIEMTVEKPKHEHPKRPIQGFTCTRSEVSGRRLWGWAAQRFGSAESFFSEHFVLNYCPLVFLEAGGRNFTPDKLPAPALKALQAACDQHLRLALAALQPEWALGIGAYAMKRIEQALAHEEAPKLIGRLPKVAQILHPSPASPAANRGWTEAIEKQLAQLQVYG
jgi:single-strand selective monofunctional uracil DNA glycosylase